MPPRTTRGRRVAVAVLLLAIVAAGGGIVRHADWLTSADTSAVRWVASWRPAWLESVMRTITEFGHFAVVLGACAVGGAILVASRWPWPLWRPLAALAAATTFGPWMKSLVQRPRPPHELWASWAPGSGYPSGHSGQAAAVWIALALVFAARWPQRRGALLGAAFAIVLLVGTSRVVLGVHSPSDVLAGWAVGAGCALLATVGLAARRR